MNTDHTVGDDNGETQRQRRGHDFYPSAEEEIPGLYETEKIDEADKIVQLHYFVGGCDWWIVEVDPVSRVGFGYACLGDPDLAEWGYVSLTELEALTLSAPLFIVERDTQWSPKPARDVHLPGRPW